MPGGIDDHDRGAQEAVTYRGAQSWLPEGLRRYLLHFEAEIERAVEGFAKTLPAGARVLDAGAGEARHAEYFTGPDAKGARYVAFDLAVGDAEWDYSKLDAVGDLAALPFRDGAFEAALNIVTLEHVAEPKQVLREIARVLSPGGRLLLIVPHEWEVHQSPHDYFRYTRHGVEYLANQAGLQVERCEAVGGYFRLMSRRWLNGLQFFPGLLFPLAAMLMAPLALVLPLFDGLDTRRDFTLGYVALLKK